MIRKTKSPRSKNGFWNGSVTWRFSPHCFSFSRPNRGGSSAFRRSKEKNGGEFHARNSGRQRMEFRKHRGKVVVVNYWATWCPPCRVETPGLVSFADEYKSRGVETVGVTVDEDLSLVPPFAENYEIKYPILKAGFDPNARIRRHGAADDVSLRQKRKFSEKIHGHRTRIDIEIRCGRASL